MFGDSGKDRRKFQRVKVGFVIVYRIDKPMYVRMTVADLEVNSIMLDLSQDGLALSTNYNIPVETELSLKFMLINERVSGERRVLSLNIGGRVCNSAVIVKGECRLGIQFTYISQLDRGAIVEFIRMAKV